jgi:hypothetical protein
MAYATSCLEDAVRDCSRIVVGEVEGVIAGEELIARVCVLDPEGKADEGVNVGAAFLRTVALG